MGNLGAAEIIIILGVVIGIVYLINRNKSRKEKDFGHESPRFDKTETLEDLQSPKSSIPPKNSKDSAGIR